MEIVHLEGDTVAVGSIVDFVLHGIDPDGDDGQLVYSKAVVVHKACGGGTNYPFSSFDTENPGPEYSYSLHMDRNPTECGHLRALARTRDEHGRADDTPAKFRFYSNLPPTFSTKNIRVNGSTLSQTSTYVTADTVIVKVTSAIDPDPGNGSGAMRSRCRLQAVDVSNDDETEWVTLGSDMVLRGITHDDTYRLTVYVSDEGCREATVDAQIDITLR